MSVVSDDEGAASRSPPTGPIVGAVLAALIAFFGFFILFKLVRRRIRSKQSHEPERPSDDPENALDHKPPSEPAAEDPTSLAHTIDRTRTKETSDSNHPELPPELNEDTQRLVPPLDPNASSSTLHPPNHVARLSATSDAETQRTSGTSFATALQSQRNSTHVP